MQANCLAEVPALHFLHKIMARVSGKRLISLVFCAMTLRLACYVALPALPTPWLVLGVEMLHGGRGPRAVALGRQSLTPHEHSSVMNCWPLLAPPGLSPCQPPGDGGGGLWPDLEPAAAAIGQSRDALVSHRPTSRAACPVPFGAQD